MKINGGEAVYRVLEANGIDTVFGLLGGSMLELYDAMYKHGGIGYIGAGRREYRVDAGRLKRLKPRVSSLSCDPLCGIGVIVFTQLPCQPHAEVRAGTG